MKRSKISNSSISKSTAILIAVSCLLLSAAAMSHNNAHAAQHKHKDKTNRKIIGIINKSSDSKQKDSSPFAASNSASIANAANSARAEQSSTNITTASHTPIQLFILNGQSLMQQAQKTSPAMENIRASFLASKLEESQTLEQFQPRLEGETSYFKTDEQSIISSFPLTSPIKNLSIGVTKEFSTGMTMGLHNKLSEEKYGSLGTDAKSAISLEFTMDLYKNILGRTSRAQIRHASYEKEIAALRKKIDERIFFINLYRIYWSIILNEESLKVSQNLLKTAQQQEKDARRRYKNGIVDLGEVTRQSSQVAQQKTRINILENNRHLHILSLKKLLPSISDMNIIIDDYSITAEESKIRSLIGIIKKADAPPLHLTHYDEIVKYTQKSYRQQKKISSAYSDLDLELYSEYNQFEKDSSVSKAFKDKYSDDSYEVGLRLSIPLGKTKKRSEVFKKQINKANYLASKQSIIANINAYHTQTRNNIAILQDALKNQKSNSSNLQTTLKFAKKKYRQARLPLKDLIEEQNLYLQSQLNEIETKSIIIEQALNYLTIFTEIPIQP